MVEKYDVAIIGSGPAGYVSAIRAAQLGFKTVCIDKRASPGGTCLNVGCIPSKALLQSTELLTHVKTKGKSFGLDFSEIRVNFPQMMNRKNEVVNGLTEGIKALFKANAITFLHGKAEFSGPHHLKVISEEEEQEVEARYIIIATGSEPISLPDLPFDAKYIVSSTQTLEFSEIPNHLVIIGGGAIGVELASVYRRLGSQVTVIEMLSHLCPGIDEALSSQLLKVLQKQGIDFLLNAKVEKSKIETDQVVLGINQKGNIQEIKASVVLVSVGRRPYTEGLRLGGIGVKSNERGFIQVDDYFRTSLPHIFAIGDVIEGSMLAHKASAEGIAVVESLRNLFSPINYLSIPNIVYTDPELASVGFTEQEADKAKIDKIIGMSFFRGNPRARCMDEKEGFVKIIGDRASGRLIGMHIIGTHASELISEGMLAIQMKAMVRDLANASQAHPTLSESIKEAALDALGEAIHKA